MHSIDFPPPPPRVPNGSPQSTQSPDVGGLAAYLVNETHCGGENQCLAQNEFWLKKMVGRQCCARPELAKEILQEASIALVFAFREYNPVRGASLRTFAFHKIRGRLKDFFRFQDSIGQYVSLEEAIETDGGTMRRVDLLLEGAPPPTDLEVDAHLILACLNLEAVVARLPRQQARAVRLRFWEDRTFLEIARALRVSKPRAHALVQTAIATLRRQLRKEEIL
ncbi:MAG: RNA polymerase sigma factor FliA [Verrucomicrobia subdivision 3 bacterium]|nr:RNA polymerase sigma factor FliA [Limisphaerales bacterium]MCS1414538.1 RNA polymerase sigma factor FliA [Limisphaerales bacterium]